MTSKYVSEVLRYIENRSLLRRVFSWFLRRHYQKHDLAEDKALLADLKARRFMPTAVLIQLSRRCNLRCTMCGWQIWKRNTGVMPIDLFRRVLSEMTLNGITELHLTSAQGEPLLSPHFSQCLEFAIQFLLLSVSLLA